MNRHVNVPRIAAWGTRAVAVVSLASALTRADPTRWHVLVQVLPRTMLHFAAAATALAGVLLLLLAHGLRRRKHRAWLGAVVVLATATVLHVVKGLDVEEACATGLLLVLLLRKRAVFSARSDPRTRWVVVQVAGSLLALSFGVGLVLVRVRLAGSAPWSEQVEQVLAGLVGLGGPVGFAHEGDADVVSFTLAGLGLVTAVVTTYLALRPAEPAPGLSPEDEQRLRGLLDRHPDSLGYFNLRRDKSVVWAPSGKAAVCYRVVSGVALVSGDPLGDPEAWPGAIDELRRLAEEHAWTPAVLGCGERAGRAWRRAGLHVLEIGDEAVVDATSFQLSGRPMRGVRQAVARIERAGYTSTVRRMSTLSDADVDEIRAAVEAWRSSETERGFSMALGRFGDRSDGDCVLVEARREGVLHAVLHFVPWGSDGLSLDVMRRDRASDNGLNEFLIAALLHAAPGLGITQVSLNFAVFRQALASGERLGAGPLLRAWRGLLVFASRWFQIDSLYRFNAKFRPGWEPRYCCYPGPADLPRVLLAALEAEAFLTWPRLRRARDWGAPTPRVAACDRSPSSASGQVTPST